MVADMANFGETKEAEDGNGEIPPSDLKGSEIENGNASSDSAESSSGESSEEDAEEVEEEERESENESCDKELNRESDEEPRATSEGNPLKHCCEKCEGLQRPCYDLVTPRKISRDRLMLMLEDEGIYECSETGLVFEVSQKVCIRYCILSWSKYGTYLNESWKFAGPIFDVECDPTILKSIQFPHSLCLADHDNEVKFSVLHVKNNQGLIEPSVDHSRNHIKWSVSSLSPVGPIVQTSKPAEHHGVVLVYKLVGQANSYSFRVYLATNNHSDIKDIQKEVRSSKMRYMKIEKPPTCQKLLEENRKYRLISDSQGDITPEDIQFTLAVVKMKGYFEAFFEQHPPFKLSLIEADSDQTVWSATIREGDCVDNAAERPRKRSESRKRSSSTSEEEFTNKKARWGDEPDGPRAPKDMTDQQLMLVAKRMGKEWKSVVICYLDLTKDDLDRTEAKEQDLTMTKFHVLDLWRRRQPKGKAGVLDLLEKLKHDDVPNEVINCLQDMLENN
ncbi:NACHT, LRR and PYD domains-containing protein 1b allele 2-like isoform X1 [Hoplias malabaricus]|uniref:NACHT, LRR and PYD domains-containing protein 1b allele 2-like isoform X1 n=2 Tax=Hoplias malabaricus TaxID=27720 RepID=UPI003462C13F